MEGECFGLPHGGMVAGIVIGLIIIILGLGLFLQASGYIGEFWSIFWPIILIIFGILILLGGIYSRRRYTEPRRY